MQKCKEEEGDCKKEGETNFICRRDCYLHSTLADAVVGSVSSGFKVKLQTFQQVVVSRTSTLARDLKVNQPQCRYSYLAAFNTNIQLHSVNTHTHEKTRREEDDRD